MLTFACFIEVIARSLDLLLACACSMLFAGSSWRVLLCHPHQVVCKQYALL